MTQEAKADTEKDLQHDSPSMSDSPQYGESTRKLFAGGDFLYTLNTEELIEKILNEDKLVLHHTIQNKQDFKRQVWHEIVSYSIVTFFFGTLFWAWLSDILRIGRDSSLSVYLYFLMPSCVLFGLHRGREYINDNPNYGWESYKEIDFSKREVHVFSAFFGKQAEHRKTIHAFDDLGLVCYVNDYWEQGSSIDLFIAKKKDIMACEKNKISRCPFISNIYYCSPEEISNEYTSIQNREKIPEHARRVIDVWLQRTGMDFFDFVTKPNQRKKKVKSNKA